MKDLAEKPVATARDTGPQLPPSVQFQQPLASMSYSDQVEAVRPPMPLQFSRGAESPNADLDSGTGDDVQFEMVSPHEVNPEDKVRFEGELAMAILSNPEAYIGTVRGLTDRVYQYIDNMARLGLIDAQAGWDTLVIDNQDYFGRPPELVLSQENIGVALREFLTNGGLVEHHLMAHGKFYWEIIEPQKNESWIGRVLKNAYQRVFSLLVGGAQESAGSVRGEVGAPFADRGRQRVGSDNVGGMAGLNPPQADGGAPQELAGASDRGGNVSHNRGVDAHVIDTENDFVKAAIEELRMPMAAGVSGTTADLVQCARILGVTSGEPLKEYGLACQGMLGAAGAHSFHEIQTVLAAVGQPYQEGNYRGVYPASFAGSAAFTQLAAAWPQFLG